MSPCCTVNLSRLSIERGVGRQVILEPSPRERWVTGEVFAAPCAYEFEESAFADTQGDGGVRCSELHELVRPCCDSEPAASARICFCGSVIGSPLLRSEVSRLSIERDVGRQVVLGPSPRECLGDWGGVRRLRVRTSSRSPRSRPREATVECGVANSPNSSARVVMASLRRRANLLLRV